MTMNCIHCGKQLCSGDCVQLHCSCSATICQRCAKKEMMTRDSRRNPYIVCPMCKACSELPDRNALDAATEHEFNLVIYGLAFSKIPHSLSRTDSKRISFVKLRNCLNKLIKNLKLEQPKETREEPPGDGLLNELRYKISVIVRQHWDKIKVKADCLGQPIDPLDLIDDLPCMPSSSSGGSKPVTDESPTSRLRVKPPLRGRGDGEGSILRCSLGL